MLYFEQLHSIIYGKSRLIPKRNLQWIRSNYPDIYHQIQQQFPSIQDIKTIYYYLKHNILNENDIPFCEVCRVNRVYLHRDKLLTICGKSCSTKRPSIQEKMKQTCLEKYGKERSWGHTGKYELGTHYLQKNYRNLDDVNDKEIMQRLQKLTWNEVAEHFGFTLNSHSTTFRFMKKYGYPLSKYNRSSIEIEVEQYVRNIYGGEIIIGSRQLIKPFEVDIYLPEKNLAIEVNGHYWHSTKIIKDKYYHQNKTLKCLEQGIHLIQINEGEFNQVWKEYIDILIHDRLIVIDIKECQIKDVQLDKFETFKKIDIEHVTLGIYFNDKLIGIIYGEEAISIPLYRIVSSYKSDLRIYCTNLPYILYEPVLSVYTPLLKGYDCGYISDIK